MELNVLSLEVLYTRWIAKTEEGDPSDTISSGNPYREVSDETGKEFGQRRIRMRRRKER
jgi:hypothetical protein